MHIVNFFVSYVTKSHLKILFFRYLFGLTYINQNYVTWNIILVHVMYVCISPAWHWFWYPAGKQFEIIFINQRLSYVLYVFIQNHWVGACNSCFSYTYCHVTLLLNWISRASFFQIRVNKGNHKTYLKYRVFF